MVSSCDWSLFQSLIRALLWTTFIISMLMWRRVCSSWGVIDILLLENIATVYNFCILFCSFSYDYLAICSTWTLWFREYMGIWNFSWSQGSLLEMDVYFSFGQRKWQPFGEGNPFWEEMSTHSSIFAWETSMDKGAWEAAVHAFLKEHIFMIAISSLTHLSVEVLQKIISQIFFHSKLISNGRFYFV